MKQNYSAIFPEPCILQLPGVYLGTMLFRVLCFNKECEVAELMEKPSPHSSIANSQFNHIHHINASILVPPIQGTTQNS